VNKIINVALNLSHDSGINVAHKKVEGIRYEEERRTLYHYESQTTHPQGLD
jgi:hypothetical protein